MTIPISAQQATELADVFAKASRAVVLYMHDNFKQLSMRQYETLSTLQFELRDTADDLITDAVDIVLDDGRGDVAALQSATEAATKALKEINDIKKAIKVITTILGLALAIPTGDLDDIYGAFKGLKESVKVKKKPEDKPAKTPE